MSDSAMLFRVRVLVSQNLLNRWPSVHGPILHVVYLGTPSESVRHDRVSFMEPLDAFS